MSKNYTIVRYVTVQECYYVSDKDLNGETLEEFIKNENYLNCPMDLSDCFKEVHPDYPTTVMNNEDDD